MDSVHAGYGGAGVLDGLSISVGGGEVVALVGPNGAGKSTVLRVIMGLIRPTEGKVLLNEVELSRLRPHEIVRGGVSYVPQEEIVFPLLSVAENLEMAQFAVNGRKARRSVATSTQEALELFPGLTGKLSQRAGSLSGGEQQMAGLARALMTKPKVLLLDEPSHGLSPRFVGVIADAILNLRDRGLGIVLVEQNAAFALELCDRGYVLDMGRVRFEGPGQDLLNSEEVRRLYLGDVVRKASDGEERVPE